MFFVTILLNELLAWMRTQMGTSSLRAIFYMDEVAGYFPPVSMPPSKPPMLTLLKQARAFGLGITLATQNPVDLDYKGLSNIGTWFLGRLQTERDKARVLEGLEGAAGQAGQKFDRGEMQRVLAGLGNRVFLMNNVHDDYPTVFQTRWAMSYLAGPLARDQISRLMADRKAAMERSGDVAAAGSRSVDAVPARPVVPAGIEERFVALNRRPTLDAVTQMYRPALYAEGSMHFVRKTADLDIWRDAKQIVEFDGGGLPDPLWQSSQPLPADIDWLPEPEEGFAFAALPDPLLGKDRYSTYKSQFKDYLYRHCSETLYKSTLVKGYAPPGDEGDARMFFKHRIREQRDEAIEKLRDKYASKVASLEKKIQTAEDRVAREQGQSRTSMISAGSSVLGALLGGLLGGRRTRASTAARGVGYAAQQREDVRRAEEALQLLEDDKVSLNQELASDLDALRSQYDTDHIELEAIEIPPRKSDLKVQDPVIVWLPWQRDSDGNTTPLF
jgi:hypothetical protein